MPKPSYSDGAAHTAAAAYRPGSWCVGHVAGEVCPVPAAGGGHGRGWIGSPDVPTDEQQLQVEPTRPAHPCDRLQQARRIAPGQERADAQHERPRHTQPAEQRLRRLDLGPEAIVVDAVGDHHHPVGREAVDAEQVASGRLGDRDHDIGGGGGPSLTAPERDPHPPRKPARLDIGKQVVDRDHALAAPTRAAECRSASGTGRPDRGAAPAAGTHASRGRAGPPSTASGSTGGGRIAGSWKRSTYAISRIAGRPASSVARARV